MSLSVPSDVSPQPHRDTRAPFAMTPHEVARDPSLTLAARVLYTVLDGHAGEEYVTRVRQDTLARELGESLRTVQRALAELVSAGLLLVERTGRSNVYQVLNPSRMTHPESTQKRLAHAQKRQKRATAGGSDMSPGGGSDTSLVAGLHKNNQEKNNQVREEPPNVARPSRMAGAAAAAENPPQRPSPPPPDPIAVETFLRALPDRLRPQATAAVAGAVADALARGWSPGDLAERIAERAPNANAGPGLAVQILRELSGQPPAEHQRRMEKPTWCGECQEATRQTETAEGLPRRCPQCHPLAEAPQRPQKPQHVTDGSGYAQLIAADLRARRSPQRGSRDPVTLGEALLAELALAEPPEALTDPQSPAAEPAAVAVSA